MGHYKPIPERYLKEIKPCIKCGKTPVIVTEKIDCFCGEVDCFIRCPNEPCNNMIVFFGDIPIGLFEWNRYNSEMFEPSEEPFDVKNCFNCQMMKRCKYSSKMTLEDMLEHSCKDHRKEI